MDDWEKFSKTLLPEKEDFHYYLNMEDITDPDYAPAKKVWKDFEIKNLGEYYNLYIESDTFLLADAFENLRIMQGSHSNFQKIRYEIMTFFAKQL